MFLALALLLTAATCGGGNDGSNADSGIEGVVTIGPMCPVERADTPCPDEPYVATIVVQDAEFRELATVQSGADGTFSFSVPPGRYWLLPQWPNDGAPPSAPEQQVTVRAGAYTHVEVLYDSGIR